MDNITNELNREITFLSSFENDKMQLANYYRAKIEYGLVFLLAILWDRNLKNLDAGEKEYVMNKIVRPSIGSIIDICRRLDIQPPLLSKKTKEILDTYPTLRNNRLGHGFVFDDGLDNFLRELKKCADALYMSNNIFTSDCDLILVYSEHNRKYEGMGIGSNGDYYHWSCPSETYKFDLGNIYVHTSENDYYRLSPFIHITKDREYYIFRSLEDQLIGKILYSQLLKTGETSKCWESWGIDIDTEHNRTKSVNGTVINSFDRNFKSYIDIGIKHEIVSFLKDNKSSVCATIWGHGGVGKTATVQKVCDELYREERKAFDYIIFLSAKDRYYDQYTGKIQSVTESRIDSFEDIITTIMSTLGIKDIAITSFNIKDYKSSCFIIIDDYETFTNSERQKIEQWIRSLDINYHKVIITTRANTIIGQEFQTNELTIEQTKKFLEKFIQNEYHDFFDNAISELNDDIIESIQGITSGRPLFLLQFARLWFQYGSIKKVIDKKINASESAVDFLYGRIYNYLSNTAQLLFVAISQIVTNDDLSNLIDKLKYITNLENKEDEFQIAFDELKKLRIVEIYNNFFRVYSIEIFQIMLKYFERFDPSLKGSINRRLLQISKNKKLDNETSLLEHANTSRHAEPEETVVSNYRQILNRTTSPVLIKTTAILNLADYLFNQRGKTEDAIRLMEEFYGQFSKDAIYIKLFASYLWAYGNKVDAVKKLSLFLHAKQDCDSKSVLELEGLYLTYASIYEISQKEYIKEQKFIGNLSHCDFSLQNTDITKQMNAIFTYGTQVFERIKKKGLADFPPAIKQNYGTGFYRFLDICIRLNKYDKGKQIADFFILETNPTLSSLFAKKREKMDMYS